MVVRLWWKELRVFWPLCAFELALAVVAQWVALRVSDAPWRRGDLTLLALSWVALYAFAVSAAAFAGEREHQTMRWLDILPVDRRTLWYGKTSFALISTFVLAIVLIVVAALGAEEGDGNALEYAVRLMGFCSLLVEAVAWGLFWSSLSRHVLPAAALAVVCVGIVSGFLADRAVFKFNDLDRTAPLRLALAAVLLIASWCVLIRRPSGRSVRVRAPRVSLSGALGGMRPSRGHSSLRSLLWQTRREALAGWFGSLLLGVVPPILMSVWAERLVPEFFAIFGGLASLLAGVSVFQPDNRARSQRFYVYHGVSPAKTWWVKTSVWFVLVAVPAVVVLGVFTQWAGVRTIALLSVAFAFATGVLAGHVIRRGITAAVVGVGLLLILLTPYVSLVAFSAFPIWLLAFPPLILLGASWAWTGDWMLERPGRWVRLGANLAVPFFGLFAGQAAYRAWSIPDLGPLPAPSATVWPQLPADQDAAEIYRAAHRALAPVVSPSAAPAEFVKTEDEIARVLLGGWDPDAKTVVSWWQANQEAIRLVRKGARLAGGNFRTARTLDIESGEATGHYLSLARLMALDAREREFRGDLRGAWDDVRAVLDMARQLSEGADVARFYSAASVEMRGLEMGLVWAAASGQTRERLHAALDELLARQERLPLGDTIKVEAGIFERTLSLSTEELRRVLATVVRPRSVGRLSFALLSWALVNPWERQRALRAGRLYVRSTLEHADLDPWQRSGDLTTSGYLSVVKGSTRAFSPADIDHAFTSTPFLRYFGWSHGSLMFRVDQNVADRRALVLMLAIRAWQLEHDGQAPERLEELIPSELTSLPVDPYSGNPFGYRRSMGQGVLPLGTRASRVFGAAGKPVVLSQPGQWLLYSVGPDRHDDGGMSSGPSEQANGDLVYPIPGPTSGVPEPAADAAAPPF